MRDYRSCKRVFEEKASGGRWDRPELYKALEQLREGDVLVVWKLDRLSRSLKDLLHIMERVRDAGAGFRSLTEPYGGRGYHNLRRTDGYADARQLCRIRALNGP